MLSFQILFWTSAAALFHSYVLYPGILKILSIGKKQNELIFEKEEMLPGVSFLIAAYNEEQVIAEKIESIFNTTYPAGQIEVLIGSDNSSDKTNEILRSLCNKFPQLRFEEFKSRQGKVVIMNTLCKKATHEIIVLTDANVIFEEETLYELVKHFKNNEIALVDSNMINSGLKKEGISVQEKTYIQAEVFIKNAESKLWGTMMGPFGGCYAMRKKYFSPMPSHFLVDDFYLNMKVLEKGGKCINEIRAKVYEDVSNNLKEELRRKARIATGNFQNLFAFSHLLFRFNAVSFCFFSHKVLRWFGPLFMITAYLTSLVLFPLNLYKWIFVLQSLVYLIPVFDRLLEKFNIHFSIFRFVTHLLAMNLALLIGFIKFSKGVRSSIWEPTKRHQ